MPVLLAKWSNRSTVLLICWKNFAQIQKTRNGFVNWEKKAIGLSFLAIIELVGVLTNEQHGIKAVLQFSSLAKDGRIFHLCSNTPNFR